MNRTLRKLRFLFYTIMITLLFENATIFLRRHESPKMKKFLNSQLRIKTFSPSFCPQIQHILFAKTHKTGGSAVQNIFFRYAYKNDLIVALPKKGHLLKYPDPIDFDQILPPSK